MTQQTTVPPLVFPNRDYAAGYLFELVRFKLPRMILEPYDRRQLDEALDAWADLKLRTAPLEPEPWEPGKVVHVPNVGSKVASSTTPDRWYMVDERGCDHPSYFPEIGANRTKKCKHIARVLEVVLAEQEERDPEFRARLRAEREAPVNTGAFVD